MPKPLQVVHTKELVVTFDPNICRHSGECVRGLPKVFDVSRPDWIRLEGTWPEEIVAVVGTRPFSICSRLSRAHDRRRLSISQSASFIVHS